MFYVFDYTLTASDLVTSKKRLDMELTAGVIHQVDVLFQKDAAHKNLVQIYHGHTQLWPSNRGGALRGDATVISFREFYELHGAVNTLTAYFWTTDASVLKEVVIQIGLLPKAVVMPLSFDELVRAVAGL
ncbi:MAG: hypothetical protein JRD89_04490 [Deltaproteobacteria bacterium]|nr:hypothetical protein [Deltaproteobacteria bacterium]